MAESKTLPNIMTADTLAQVAKQAFAAFKKLAQQCKADRITVSAGHLAYVSLLSLKDTRSKLESLIFDNFVPHAGGVVQEYVSEFVNNASQMSALSILFLVVVALMLISNVDKTLNRIWQKTPDRPAIFTFAIYWMVITLGPLLMGSSLAMTSYLVGLTSFAEEYTPGLGTLLLRAGPFIAELGAFFIIYMVVPTVNVKPKHAVTGALLASVLFEFSKKAFALYISNFDSYQVIYGALATIPILFVWVYLSWIVVLVGAVFTYVLGIEDNE